MSIFNLGTMDSSKDNANKEPVKEVPAMPDAKDQTPENNGTPAKIVISGPLSEIYTKALNEVYANEGTELMLPPMVYTKDNTEEDPDANLYVYCCNVDNIDMSDAVNEIKDMSSKSATTIVAIECKNLVTNKVGLLENFATVVGAKVCFSQEKAIAAVKSALTGV